VAMMLMLDRDLCLTRGAEGLVIKQFITKYVVERFAVAALLPSQLERHAMLHNDIG